VIGHSFAASPLVPTNTARSGWRWHRLTELARLATGHTPSRRHPEYWDGDIPWIQLPDIRALDGRTATDASESINELGIQNSAAVLLPAGTVCLSRTASVGFVTIIGRPMATSQDFVNWVCGPDLCPHFLMYLLLANRQSIRGLGSGAVHHTVYFPAVESFSVCVPDVKEQRRIVDSLAEELAVANAAIQAADKRRGAARALADAYLREVFDGPEAQNWPRGSIASLGNPSIADVVQTGPFGAQLPSSEFRAEGVPVLNIGNVKNGRLNLEHLDHVSPQKAEALARYRLRAGDMLFTRSGSVGRSAVVDASCEGWLISYHLLRVSFDLNRIEPGFVSAAIRGDSAVLAQVRKAAGRGATRDGINASILEALVVPTPSLDKQRAVLSEIDRRLNETRALITACEAELATLTAIPAALLQMAFGGEA
jgi:type I restriction enzyme S subunit